MEKLEHLIDEDLQKLEMTPVQFDLEDAIAKAKEFHPVTKLYIDGYTGEVNRYKTPDNYVPDEGVVNELPDLCHTEEHVTVAQIYARLKNMKALSIASGEFEFNEGEVSVDDLEEDTISDIVSEVEDPSDYDYVNEAIVERYGKPAEQQVSDSAAEKQAVESKNEDKATGVAADE